MDDEQKSTTEPHLVSELHAAGIPDEMLKKGADAARRLCAGAGSLRGGTLDPRSGSEYQHLLASLARKVLQ